MILSAFFLVLLGLSYISVSMQHDQFLKVYQESNKNSYVAVTIYGHFNIPDLETLEALGLSSAVVPGGPPSSGCQTTTVCPSVSIPKLNKAWLDNPHVQLEVLLQIAALHSNPVSWSNMMPFQRTMNPSLVRWQNRLLVAWRTGRFESDIRFQFVSSVTLPGGQLSLNMETNQSFTDVTRIPSLGLGETKDDPRLIVLPCRRPLHGKNGTTSTIESLVQHNSRVGTSSPHCKLLVLYAFYHPGRYGIARQAATEVTWQKETHSMIFSSPVQLETYPLQDGMSSKNWMPFVHKGETFFITSMSPWRVVKYPVTEWATKSSKPFQKDKVPTQFMENVTEQSFRHGELPWRTDLFGDELRGGTNALRISSSLYLAFFHTSVSIHGRRVYFMGAFTFCALAPTFRLHSMHAYPVIKDTLYSGKFVNKHVMFVVFPMSLVPENGGSGSGVGGHHGKRDGDVSSVLLTFGHNDRDAYTVRFNVSEILETMVTVQSC